MELFLLLPDLQSKNLFYKRFVITSKDSQNGFENKKWNYPNRKWNYFSYFLTFDQKTSFTKYFKILSMSLKLVLKTGNGIIQTGNGIISPIS